MIDNCELKEKLEILSRVHQKRVFLAMRPRQTQKGVQRAAEDGDRQKELDYLSLMADSNKSARESHRASRATNFVSDEADLTKHSLAQCQLTLLCAFALNLSLSLARQRAFNWQFICSAKHQTGTIFLPANSYLGLFLLSCFFVPAR